MISISVTSLYVRHQAEALTFYTDILGFEKALDIPLGEARWLTVVSPAARDGVQLLLEPGNDPIAAAYQQALHDKRIPATTFAVDDLHAEYERMTALGVRFTGPPSLNGNVSGAVFDDTCGNYIGLHHVH